MDRLHLVNALVNGHLAALFAMLLNWSATGSGNGWAVYGILFVVLAWGSAWLSSSIQGTALMVMGHGLGNESTEKVRKLGGSISLVPALFTVLSWACYLLPALLR